MGQARRDRRFLQSACPNKDDDDDDDEEEDEDDVDDYYNREDDDDKNHNHEDDDSDRQAKRFIAKSLSQLMLQLFHGTNKISLYIIIIYKKTYQTYFFAMS